MRYSKGFFKSSWDSFCSQWLADLKLFGFIVIYLQFWRGIFISLYSSHIADDSGGSEIFATILNGLRFDSVIAVYFVSLAFIFSAASGFLKLDTLAVFVRKSMGVAFLVLSTFLYVISFEYFGEFNDQLNFFAINFLYDDKLAVTKTAWKEYHLLGNTLIAVSVISISVAGLFKFLLSGTYTKQLKGVLYSLSLPSRIFVTFILLVFLIVAGRGSLGSRPVQQNDIAVTKDPFLNKMIINPFFALKYAVQGFNRGRSNSLVTAEQARAALKHYFNTEEDHDSVDRYMLKHAKGATRKPRHVFLIVLESYDSWAMQEKFKGLHLTDNLKALASEGVGLMNFLPASKATILSFTSILIGMQDYRANYKPSSIEPFPSSAASTFEHLGYTPRLFYGGYPSWQRLELFARNQGFKEFYSAPVMGDWTSTNEWGVDDEHLFDFVLNKIDPDTPSFNMILTTTFHPPYDIDIENKGFELKTLPPEFEKLHTSKSVDINILGHLWYMDQSVGEFVRKAEALDNSALFAITGDHYGRKHLSANPTPYEFNSVPLVLYGKEALKGRTLPADTAASHVDIVPTLVELSAPEGFEYYSMGTDIFDPDRRPYGIGSSIVIGKDFILYDNKVHPLPFDRPVPENLNIDELGRLASSHSSIGWWRIMKGPRLPEMTVPAKK